MAYTKHGHHIPNSPMGYPKPRVVARCGGPGVCQSCSNEVSLYFHSRTKESSSMIETTMYVRKPFEVEAVQVTEENLELVSEWCRGMIHNEPAARYIKVNVARPLNVRQTKAYPGDWVLFANNGFKVYTDKAFEKTFDLKAADQI